MGEWHWRQGGGGGGGGGSPYTQLQAASPISGPLCHTSGRPLIEAQAPVASLAGPSCDFQAVHVAAVFLQLWIEIDLSIERHGL